MHLVDYSDVIREICTDVREHAALSKRVWGGCKRKFDAMVKESSTSSLMGDKYLRDVRETLDSLGFVRTKAQVRFHEEFIKASIPHIYPGMEFEDHKEEILASNGMETLLTECLVCTPRRFGKTTACAMYCAALALCTPEAWISIFSTGQRASTMLLELTSKMIMNAPDGKSRILKKNTEQLYIRGDGPGDVRRIYSYPSSVQVSGEREREKSGGEGTDGSRSVRVLRQNCKIKLRRNLRR
jgi:hypothetical protein